MAITDPQRRSGRTKSPGRVTALVTSQVPAEPQGQCAAAVQSKAGTGAGTSNNWVDGGLGDGTLMVPFLLFFCPLFAQMLAHLTAADATVNPTKGLTGLAAHCYAEGAAGCAQGMLNILKASMTIVPTWAAVRFLLGFGTLALILDVCLPGKPKTGPETLTGHVPKYTENGLLHCFLFTSLFWLGSTLGLGAEASRDVLGPELAELVRAWSYDFGVFYDLFPAMISVLNILGMVLALFLYFKGLYFPSTADCGSSGSFLKDFTWGTELYPRVLGVDIKRFVNCRFSMTFWMLAGLSFTYRSYTLNGAIDYGLLLSAASQFFYLVKFFAWEMGYMSSIDIIVDRAGWEIQWGCLVWVPSVYTLHSRFLVQNPSGLSLGAACVVAGAGFAGVLLNYWADEQRRRFREAHGNMLVFGRKPEYVKVEYEVVDRKTGDASTRTSLLLASGFWGVARHFHYVFELVAAWSWCMLANPVRNGALPLFYAVFLTLLLADRAKRDERKCRCKYGKFYEKYTQIVPYFIIPGIY